jgi:ABC-type Mn2+/Zn2+ transport system permease subunit
MWTEFIISWPLFHNAWLSGWMIAITMAIVGVWVVAKDQIFLGAAVTQASTCGVAIALGLASWLGMAWLHDDIAQLITAVLTAMISAAIVARTERHPEATIGWIYLTAASSSVLVVAHSPHGLDEVQRLFSSSIIGSSRTDVILFAAMTAITTLAVWLGHRRLVLCALDPIFAQALGVHPRRISGMAAIWLGVTVGLSIHTAGALYCLGCLVLPALIAFRVGRELGAAFWIAPSVALAISILAFVIANSADLPPGQVTVVGLVATLATASAWSHCRKK